LSAGDVLVIRGAEALRDGVKVRVVEGSEKNEVSSSSPRSAP
jgi:hypothetical protein